MRQIDCCEYDFVYGGGCGRCYVYTNDGWVDAGIYYDKWVYGKFYNFCTLCNGYLSPHSVSCSRSDDC